jgi:hypothetical protein
VLSSRPDDPNRDLFSADRGAPWYALRRYACRATPEAYAAALAHARPEFEKRRHAPVDQWEELRRRDYLAYAFARETHWPEELLAAFVEHDERFAELPVLLAACTDAALAMQALQRWGSLSEVYFAFDMVEAMGREAVPLLQLVRASRAPDRKRVAAALAIAQAL